MVAVKQHIYGKSSKNSKIERKENMKKTFAIMTALVMVLAFAASAPAAGTGSPYDALDRVYIGVMLPLTGPGAMTGWFVQEGIKFWLEDNPDGISGKPVELIYADTQSTETGATAAYLTIATDGRVSASHGGQFSNQGLAILPQSLSYKLPTIHHGSSVRFGQAVREGHKYTWQNRINDQGTGFSMANAIHNVLGAKKIAVIHDNNAFGQGLADNAIAALKSFGVEPVVVLSYTTNEKQFAGMISRIAASGADGMLMMAHPNESALIQIEVQNAGLEIIKLGSPDAGGAMAISLAEDAANGWYSISDWVPTIADDPGKTFAKKFFERHEKHADMNTTSTYDIMTVFKAAIEHAGSQDPAAVQAALEYFRDNKVEIQGLATIISFSEFHLGNTSQFLALNVDGVAQMIERIPRADRVSR